MDYNFELQACRDRFYLNTPSTNHLQFRCFPKDTIINLTDVKNMVKELRAIVKIIKSEYNVKVTLKGLDKSVLEFSRLHLRYLSAINSVNEKYNEALEFAKKYKNVPFCREKADEISVYSLELQNKYNHYFYRNGDISICNEIVSRIEKAIDDFKFLKINIENGGEYSKVTMNFPI